MKLKRQCLFMLIMTSFISCDLLFDEDIQKKSAGLLDRVQYLLNNKEQTNKIFSDEMDKTDKPTKRVIKKIVRKPRQKGQQEQIDKLQQDGVPNSDSVLFPQIEEKNLPLDITSIPEISKELKETKGTTIDSNTGDLSGKDITSSLSGTTYLSSQEGSNLGGFSDFVVEYAYSSYPTVSGSYSGSIVEEEDSPEYEYNDKLDSVAKDIDYALEAIEQIKKDRDQVDLQSTMRVSGHSTQEERKVANEKLQQFSKEKLAQELQSLFDKIKTAYDLIDDASEDYAEFIAEDELYRAIYILQDLFWSKYGLYDLVEAVGKTSSTYEAYVKRSGLGFAKISEVEQSLKKAKELLAKRKNSK
ncbi:BBK32 immunogenic protein P35 (plasmid) [Borrelia recurrentis]|uniref:Outer surface protein n=1 Tax=Borrelia recurrentis TaxID=44449 RepID=E1UIV7_9SPIR|nr:outer surface protein precursor [Borrelia recurrentis A1]